MKQKNIIVATFASLVAIVTVSLDAVTRDASTGDKAIHVAGMANFLNGECAKGLVFMRGGVDLAPGARVLFNVPVPTEGPHHFGNDSTLVLMGDYHLSSHATLSIGKNPGDSAAISGGGNTVFMHGDLSLPADRTLSVVSSDVTIDGGNNTFAFENERSSVVIGAGQTLTLKNMALEGLSGSHQIKGSGKLVLRNVTVNLPAGTTWALAQDNAPALVVDGLVHVRGGGQCCLADSAVVTVKRFSNLVCEDSGMVNASGSDVKRNIVLADATAQLHMNRQQGALRTIMPAMDTRTISAYPPNSFPIFPATYSPGVGANQFDPFVVFNLATDVSNFANNVERWLVSASSNTLLYLTRNLSNTLLFLDRTDSNTKLFLARNNSNAIIKNGRDIRSNSNTLLFLDRNDSNAKLFLARNLSNTVRYLTRNNSNAIIKNGVDIRTNSNAMLARTRHNSNTLLFLEKNDSNTKLFLARNNSNTLRFLARNNSNTLLARTRHNSNTLLFLERTDSNTKLFLARNLSNTVRYLTRNNSNTLLARTRHNSNTLLFLERNDSNTKLFLARNLSNTLLYFHRVDSNAIVWLDTQLQTIDHGPFNVIVNTPVHTLEFDIYISSDHLLIFENTYNDYIFNGNGHYINLASKSPGIIQIPDGVHVTFKDVVFKNYNDDAFLLGEDASVTFGDCTRLELYDMQEQQRPWIFQGETQVRGYDTRLMLQPYGGITVRPHSRLSMHNISLDGLADNNIHCEGVESSLVLKDAELCLASDYSFTSGSILFFQDVRVTGSHVFHYATDLTSTVTNCSQLHIDCAGFRYEPVNDKRDLLLLIHKSSTLFLDGTTLESTTTGMRLIRGKLLVDHVNKLVNTGAISASEGFAFGNGLKDDDLTVNFKPGGSLTLVDGILDYQNSDA